MLLFANNNNFHDFIIDIALQICSNLFERSFFQGISIGLIFNSWIEKRKKKFLKEFIFFGDRKIDFSLSLFFLFIPPNLVPRIVGHHVENLVVNNHGERDQKVFNSGQKRGFPWLSRFPKHLPFYLDPEATKRWPSSSLVSGTTGSRAKRDSVNKVAAWWLFFVIKLCCTARVQCKRCLQCLVLPLKRHFHLKEREGKI